MVEGLSARVYRGLREGRLDGEEVVGLACELMDRGRWGGAVREAVERDPAGVTPGEMARLARRILDETGFDPGFELAPERLDVLRRALRIAARDLPTAGIVGEPRLVVLADAFPPAAGVALADGRWFGGNGELHARVGDHPPGALAAVAGVLQEGLLLERTRRVWPLCADHGRGVHPVERGDTAVWWCAGASGHAPARIGELALAHPS